MPLRKSPNFSLFNGDQPALDPTASTPPSHDEPPPAYGTLPSPQTPSSHPDSSTSPPDQSPEQTQVQTATNPQPPSGCVAGYTAHPPMCSTTPPTLKPWEIPPAQRAALEKAPGCFCSDSGGCFCSDMGGFCFSSNGGCFFSDNKGCFFSDHSGFCFGDYGGCFCSGGQESLRK